MASPSASEGEIVEMEVDKASLVQPTMRDNRVDRRSRTASTESSPADSVGQAYERFRSRSRSPYRHKSPRREKRCREDDHSGDRDRHDPRRFRVRYESFRRGEEEYRHRVSYADIDRSDSRHYPRHGERSSRGRNRRHRTRSRSPGQTVHRVHQGRKDDRYDACSRRSSPLISLPAKRGAQYVPRRDTGCRLRENGELGSAQDHSVSRAMESDQPTKSENKTPVLIGEPGGVQSQDGPTGDLMHAELTELDEVALIEQRRKRREALKAKYKSQPTPLLAQALQPGGNPDSTPATAATTPIGTRSGSPEVTSPKYQVDDIYSPAPFAPPEGDISIQGRITAARDEADEPSAADYDPTLDMQEDKAREDQRLNNGDIAHNRHDRSHVGQQDELTRAEGSTSKAEFDMFADDDEEDIFALEPTIKEVPKASEKTPKELDQSLLDNWDDPEGYYRIIIGELLDGRYHVLANLGKGMFSAVVRATDNKTSKTVAIKIIRNNETMRKAGLKEIDILQKLLAADPDDKKHIVRLERQFEHKGHLCMVFENLSINLREVLKKFGRDIGINLKAVRSYAQQMFLSLSLLKKCNILHADLKPDNILVNETRSMLKVCDLGSAGDASENEITPYLVSRFYRAPEIILGMPYEYGIDMWSIGCTLYELYTGKILFTGRNNNQMLRSIMECRGKFSVKMLKKAEYAGLHFDDNLTFRSMEKDKVTGKHVVRILNFVKPNRDLKSRLIGGAKGLSDSEAKELNLFVDLLDRCLALNPEKRITPSEALKHPFINRAKS